MYTSQPKSRDGYCTATDLAQMMVCERQVFLRSRYGDRKTAAQREASRAGVAVHDRMHKEALRHDQRVLASQNAEADKRCYVATCVYGAEAPETRALRDYRDNVLNHSLGGRWFVKLYYWLSPWVVRVFGKSELTKRVMRVMTDRIVEGVAK